MSLQIQSQNFSLSHEIRYQMVDRQYRLLTHIHQFAELVFLLEGELTVTVDGRAEQMLPGQATFIFPFQRHGFSSESETKLAILLFSPSMLSDFFSSSNGLVGQQSVFTPSEATRTAFTEKIFQSDDVTLSGARGCLYLALDEYLRSTEFRNSSSEYNMSAAVIGYITEHITENMDLTSISAALGYSPKYLSNCIGKLFGMNLPTVIAAVRVNKAKYLLRETDKTGLEIMTECGFTTERSYHRQFKLILGKSPKYIRQTYYKGAKIDQGKTKTFE